MITKHDVGDGSLVVTTATSEDATFVVSGRDGDYYLGVIARDKPHIPTNVRLTRVDAKELITVLMEVL